MAKAKKGKKAKAGKSSAADGGDLTPAQTVTLLRKENEVLQRNVAADHKESHAFQMEKDALYGEVRKLRRDFVDHGKDTLDLKSDMTRQYKAMQKTMSAEIAALEQKFEMRTKELENERQEKDKLKKDLNSQLKDKEQEVADLREKMENMAQEFGDMLKHTLEKLSERIEIHGEDWDKTDTDEFKEKMIQRFNDES